MNRPLTRDEQYALRIVRDHVRTTLPNAGPVAAPLLESMLAEGAPVVGDAVLKLLRYAAHASKQGKPRLEALMRYAAACVSRCEEKVTR